MKRELLVLGGFADEELIAELRRREEKREEQKIPKQLDSVDLTSLREVCQMEIDELAQNGWADNDNEHYIYAEAMKAIFGDDVFDWINEKIEKTGRY